MPVKNTTLWNLEFGIWPQTKYSGTAELKPCEKGINAWEQSVCYTDGTDNYIKVTAAPAENTYTFDDGSKVEAKEYYFKLEPIQWRVLTNDYNGKKLLFAEKALAASCFYKDTTNRVTDTETIYPNNYKESNIRTFLNKDFINKAFTPAEIAKISETVVDNSAASTFGTGETGTENQYACDNTKDKIFLLSEKEITTADYGFDAYDKYGADSTRIRKTTDYARATGAGSITDAELKLDNSSAFWLRSPSYDGSDYARFVDIDGRADYYDYVDTTYVSVVPALSMTF